MLTLRAFPLPCLPSVLLACAFRRPSLTWYAPCLCVSYIPSACRTTCLCTRRDPLWPGMFLVCASPSPCLPGVLPVCVLRRTLYDLACSLSVHSLHFPLPAILPAYVLRRTLCGLACSLSVHLLHPVCLVYCRPMLSEGPSVAGHFPCLCISCSPSASFTPCMYSLKPQDPSAKQL